MSPAPAEDVLATHDLDFAVRRHGDGGDRTAVLFHGFPDDAATFDPLAERLVDAGYRTVAPYMRGYGDTDRPALDTANYAPELLASDVAAVLAAVDADDPLVVGHDWGAIAVTAYSVLDPGSFGHAVTMAVPPNFLANLDAHASQALRSWYMTLFQIPGVAEEVLQRDDFALLERLWNMWSPDWEYDPDHLAHVKETFRTGETVEAALLYYRAMFESFMSQPSEALQIQGIDVPTLFVTGRNDGAVGADMFAGCEESVDARSRFELVTGAGHFVHREEPDEVADAILDFVE